MARLMGPRLGLVSGLRFNVDIHRSIVYQRPIGWCILVTGRSRAAYDRQALSSSWDGRPFGHNRHRPRSGGCTFLGGRCFIHLTQCRLGRGLYLHNKWHLDPSSRLPTTDIGRKLGACPFGRGSWVHHLTQCGQGRGLPPRQVSSWSIQPRLVTIHQRYRQDRQTDNGPIA